MENTQGGYVKSIDLSNGIRQIEFFHPGHNSLPGYLLKELAESIRQAGNDHIVKLIILKSAGDRTFCAGASFDELMRIETDSVGKDFFMGFANVINAMRLCPRIIIGRIHGKAVGGGVGLAAATDYCFATKHAAIKLSELAVGIGPFVIGPAVERKLGLSSFSQLAINAFEWQNAYWARDKGLYTAVHDSVKEMDEAIDILSQKLSKSNPDSLVQLKKVFWEGTSDWQELLEQRAAMSGQLVLSTYAKDAIAKIKRN